MEETGIKFPLKFQIKYNSQWLVVISSLVCSFSACVYVRPLLMNHLPWTYPNVFSF